MRANTNGRAAGTGASKPRRTVATTTRKEASPDHIGNMAARLGISREEVERACDNLMNGDGKIYRKVIFEPLHGKSVAAVQDRRERWHRIIAARLTELEANGLLDGVRFIPPAWFEEIEGRPMADVIADNICRERGYGVSDPTPMQMYNAELDDRFETYDKRTRNAHDREVSNTAVSFHLNKFGHSDLIADEIHALIRKFYRKGDIGLRYAENRAMRSAIVNRVAG